MSLTASDTLIVDEGLLPNRQYTYTLTRPNGLFTERLTATITTMDTTSHDGWTWQIDTLGVTSSVLYDCQIISEDNIWCVGELFLNDSSGQLDPIPYNAARWNGAGWDIRRITWQGYPAPIKFIFAYNENDIWFGMGYLVHWNGTAFREIEVPPLYGVSSNKMWGSPNGELYVVGNSGTIAYSPDHGATWQRLESGTTVDINDIWGSEASASEQPEIVCGASNRYSAGERKLLRLNGDLTVGLIPWTPQTRINTVWFTSLRQVYVGGSGLFLGSPGQWREVRDLPLYFSTRIRGNQINDVFVVGAYGLCGHFNGLTWHNYPELQQPGGSYEGLAVGGNLVVAVGDAGGRALVLRGYR
jgi:hypothetical protein